MVYRRPEPVWESGPVRAVDAKAWAVNFAHTITGWTDRFDAAQQRGWDRYAAQDPRREIEAYYRAQGFEVEE